MYKLRLSCRACGYGASNTPHGIKSGSGAEKLIPVFSLGLQPLSNDFCSDLDEHHGFAPLEVLFCPRCSLAQLSATVRPDILYSNYKYVTSTSDTMLRHFENLYAALNERATSMDKILEIGSNDGAHLNWLACKGHKVCGIDPAENLHPDTVESICDVLCSGSAELARFKLEGPADVVIARHVFCHVDDWYGFMKALENVTHPESLIAIEVPYVGHLLEQNQFDTIYFEHTSYMSLKAIVALLERTNFALHDVIDFDIHGGVICLIIRPKASQSSPNPEALKRVDAENITEGDWQHFNQDVKALICELKITVARARAQRKVGCAYGASAKCTVLLNACGFTRKDIAFVADTTKLKWYKNVPGTDIPVVDDGALLREMPDFALMTCWNFRKEVLQKNKLYTDKGGKFIVPIPEVEIVP